MIVQQVLALPSNPTLCPLAIMYRDGSVLFGHRHYTDKVWKHVSVWTLPGGRSNPGETVEQALRCEVEEEVAITEFEIVAYLGEAPGAKDGDTVLLFFCTTAQDAVLLEPAKFSEWRWVSASELRTNTAYNGFNPGVRALALEFLSRLDDLSSQDIP